VKNSLTLSAVALTLALLTGCGSSSYSNTGTTSSTSAATASSAAATTSASPYSHASTPTTSTTTTAAAGTGAGAMTITSKHGKLGTVLAAGPKKLTVYLFEADKGASSACAATCAAVWPPVTTSAAPQSSAGAMAGDLGTITRSDGSKQVTYKGHPLYYFARDKDAGDAYGQGSKSFGAGWYVLAPSGKKIDPS
jgi:predicted lipoprotein with Yx(FWY)xxD motif